MGRPAMGASGRVYDVFTKGGTYMPKSESTSTATPESKAKAVEHDLVDVALDAKDTVSVVIKNVRVDFIEGVAKVHADIAKALKDAGLVK